MQEKDVLTTTNEMIAEINEQITQLSQLRKKVVHKFKPKNPRLKKEEVLDKIDTELANLHYYLEGYKVILHNSNRQQ